MRAICTALDRLHSEEYAYTGILWPTFFITVKKLRELQTNIGNVAICLQLVTDMIEFVQERFDKVLSNTEHQVAIALPPHFQFSLMSDADNQFYQFTSESTPEKIKTKMILMVEFLQNEEDLRATSSSDETEEAVK